MHRIKEILVIEDDFEIRDSLRELLEEEGFRVQIAEHGAVALELLKNREVDPVLIFVDLMMPVMDGRTFLQEFGKRFPELGPVQICILTAAGRIPTIENRNVRIIWKPLEVDELMNTVEELVGAAA
jgi:CheY-like chemotaxis protein